MAWCGYSRKGRQYRASSGGGAAGWSVSTSIPYILWLRCSNKALRPFSRGVYGWVFCAKNWQLSAAEPVWVQQHAPLDWYTRYGLRSDQARLPKEASKREALARQVGVDGYQLLDGMWAADSPPYLCNLPALEALRQIWVQQYYRCTVPGREEG